MYFLNMKSVFPQFLNSSSFATMIRPNTFFQTALRKKVDFKFLWSKNKHFFTKIDWLESKTLQKFCCKVFNPTTRVPFYGRMKFTLFHRRRNRTRRNSKKMHSLSILFLFKKYFHSFWLQKYSLVTAASHTNNKVGNTGIPINKLLMRCVLTPLLPCF